MINTAEFRGTMVACGFTQKSLAEYLHMSENALSAKIRGVRPFTLGEVRSICEAFHLTDPVVVCKIFLP